MQHTRICSPTDPGIPDAGRWSVLEGVDARFAGCFDADFPQWWKVWLPWIDRRFLLTEQSADGEFAICRSGYYTITDTNRLCRVPDDIKTEFMREIVLCAPAEDLVGAKPTIANRPAQCPVNLLEKAGFLRVPDCG